MSKMFSVRVPDALLRKVEAEMKEQNTTATTVILDALAAYFDGSQGQRNFEKMLAEVTRSRREILHAIETKGKELSDDVAVIASRLETPSNEKQGAVSADLGNGTSENTSKRPLSLRGLWR